MYIYIYTYIPRRPATRKSVRQEEQDKHADKHAKRKLSRDHEKENEKASSSLASSSLASSSLASSSLASPRPSLGETAETLVAAAGGSSRKLGRRGGWVELGGAEVCQTRGMRDFKVRFVFLKASLTDFWYVFVFVFFLLGFFFSLIDLVYVFVCY
jgi:hypothetical protein